MLPGDGSARESLAADGCEASLEVGDDVVDVLGADGQADGVLVDLLLGQLLIGQLAVSGGSRVDDQTLDVGHICQQREDLQVVDELECFLTAALDVEGEDGSAAVGEVLLIQGVVGVIRQRGMVDLLDLGMVSTHRLASWEFHCFSTASAAFHKVLRSAYSCGALGGSRISLWTIPRFSG